MWPFSRKPKLTPPKRLFTEYPLGIRYALLFDYYGNLIGKHPYEVCKQYHDYCSQLEDIIVDRNVMGKALEKEGKLDKAILLYEQNVSDLVDTPHPYTRLRIIYTKQKLYDEAIRVCIAYIDAMNKKAEVLKNKKYALPKKNEFAEWVTKLEARKAK